MSISQALAGLEHLWKQNSCRGNVKPGSGITWFWQSTFNNLWSFRAGFYHWQSRFSATASWWLSLQANGIWAKFSRGVSNYNNMYPKVVSQWFLRPGESSQRQIMAYSEL